MLLIKMQEYCLSPKSEEETKIHNLHALYGRKLGYAYTGFLLGHSVLFILSALGTRLFHANSNHTESSNKISYSQTELSHRVNYMVDLDTYYVPIFIHTAICDYCYTYLITVFDVLRLTLVEYCCGLYAALRYRLKTALVFENEYFDSNEVMMTTTKDKSYSNIVYSIRRHAETMQFIVIMESVYTLPLFITMGITMLDLSLLGYQINNNTEDFSRLLKPITYINGVLINVFIHNWQGQKIINSSEKVFESACNAEWYNMPIASRKLLIMMMMKSKRPSILKIGRIFILSYVTFNAVLRMSLSYFMLLQSL